MNRHTAAVIRPTIALLGLAVVFATALPQTGFAQNNPWIGTWKLNVAKSTFQPSPGPKSATLVVEAVGQGFRNTIDGIDSQGNPTKALRDYLFDGKSHSLTGVPDYDAESYKRVNDSTYEVTRTKVGNVIQTATNVVSADGKTMTVTTTGVNAKGQQINNVVVLDRQ
jgi:hypothetical protein